jgi:predicted amidohydrolase
MKIAVCQFPQFNLDLKESYEAHASFISRIQDVDAIFFPELSFTGYFVNAVQISNIIAECEEYSDSFMNLAKRYSLLIGVGMPVQGKNKPRIGMKIFDGKTGTVQVYSKQLLHSTEVDFWEPGEEQILLQVASNVLAPAICFESKQSSHTLNAIRLGATIYVACVAEDEESLLNRSFPHYEKYSKDLVILLSNCVGNVNNVFIGQGWSSAYRNGECICRADSTTPGCIIYDPEGTAAFHSMEQKSISLG